MTIPSLRAIAFMAFLMAGLTDRTGRALIYDVSLFTTVRMSSGDPKILECGIGFLELSTYENLTRRFYLACSGSFCESLVFGLSSFKCLFCCGIVGTAASFVTEKSSATWRVARVCPSFPLSPGPSIPTTCIE
jgi:hypothetical protein